MVEEDSIEEVPMEDEMEAANNASSFLGLPKILPSRASTRKHPKILPAILNVPAFVGCLSGVCFCFFILSLFFRRSTEIAETACYNVCRGGGFKTEPLTEWTVLVLPHQDGFFIPIISFK